MRNTEDYLNIKIHTQKGLTPIKYVNIGDTVYDYTSGNSFKIKGIYELDKSDIYKIKYTDNREDYFAYNAPLYIGNGITDIETLLNINIRIINNNKSNKKINPMRGNIKQFPIDYKNTINTLLSPDPYIAGALLIYGDSSSEYVNLPMDMTAANTLFANKYQLNYGDWFNTNGIYFSFDGSNENIKWKEFFPMYKCQIITNNQDDPIIPIEYMRASINDRWKFIRGIFDIGYDKCNFKDGIGITHSSEDKLKAVQDVLWSLGILSKIIYSPNINTINDRVFQLHIIDKYKTYPGFFYDYNSIENMMNTNSFSMDFKMQIKSIKWHCSAYYKNILLDKSNMVYLTDNFLPRVSL